MDAPQTWHYGLIAEYWAEFNDDFRPHEVPYFRRYVENGCGAALDVACGTGRLLIPYLRAGLDVDGCDVSPDMVALCRDKAEREGLRPTLWAQPMHELDPPRAYATIYVCGAFGLGSTREQDAEALRRFHTFLEPGGTLLIDIEVPYADSRSDGSEYGLRARVVAVDPLEQRLTYEMHAQRWRDELEAEETRRIDIRLYFKDELLLMLVAAGFSEVDVQGDHNDKPATADDDFIVFVAKK
ncbi:MAG: class I SAM-dependent methyltransferase [Actinobacteria bacterium]|nr:MAG: class I SAM-dependent methyltransferase [Actinomycetota bacterium]